MSLLQSTKKAMFRAVRYVVPRGRPAGAGNCILVLQSMLPLGGCVHATPLFTLLKHDLPNLPVWVATRGLGLEVLRHNPDIAGLIELPDALQDLRTTGAALRLALKARSLWPEWIVLDSSNPRTKIALLGALFARAPLVGYSEAAGLLTLPLKRDSQNRSLLEDNLRIGQALGATATHYEPRVFFSAEVAAEAERLLIPHNPKHLPIAVFSTQPSGGQPTAWHSDRFAAVAEALAARGFLPVFVGTAAQSPALEALQSASSCMTVSLAGKTDIRLLAGVLARADLCITIDTGTMHVARAVGVPMVVLAPVFQSPVEWLPLNAPQAVVLRGEGTRAVGADYRLDEITVPAVLDAVDTLLRNCPPSPAACALRLAAAVTDVDHLA